MIGASEILLILFVPVFVIVFWLWMLIDCLKRQDERFALKNISIKENTNEINFILTSKNPRRLGLRWFLGYWEFWLYGGN